MYNQSKNVLIGGVILGNLSFFEDFIENKLLSLHTAYLAKVLSTNGKTAKLQPLGMVKAYGETAKAQSPLSNVPIANSAKYKISSKHITYIGEDVAVLKPLSTGDIVVCICCERDITEAKNGKNSVPALGRHSMSNSVIVGVL